MSAISMLAISAVLFFFWPVVYNGLVAFGKGISSLGFVGAGLYHQTRKQNSRHGVSLLELIVG
jgi:phosphotransferase system  glucose/maltose/N-acetylglucosamine-specific IIC component